MLPDDYQPTQQLVLDLEITGKDISGSVAVRLSVTDSEIGWAGAHGLSYEIGGAIREKIKQLRTTQVTVNEQ